MSDERDLPNADPGWKPVWKNRRRTIFGALFFCAALIAFVVWKDSDSVLHRTALESAFTLAGVVILGYVFGVVYQDTRLHGGGK